MVRDALSTRVVLCQLSKVVRREHLRLHQSTELPPCTLMCVPDADLSPWVRARRSCRLSRASLSSRTTIELHCLLELAP